MWVEMKWIEVMVKTSMENEDYVSDILYQAGADGLAIEDPKDVLDLSQHKEDWDFVDSSLIKSELDELRIKAYFPESKDIENIKRFIRKNIQEASSENGRSYGEIIFDEVDDNDWSEAWKQYYKPQRIGENIVIKPSWESFEADREDLIIELDPGMAFGTGTHETTIMCTEALESIVRPGDAVYDIGCGSGILSIVAAKLGASKVVGVDLDPTCIKVSKENILKNHVENNVEIIQGDLLDVVEDKVNIIVSNIIAEIIVKMTGKLKEYLLDNGIFIASGIILEKIDLVKNDLIKNGFEILDTKILGEWACIIAKK